MKWMSGASGSFRLVVLAGVVGAMALLTCAATIEADRRATINEAKQRNAILAQVLEEHARRAFDYGGVSLADLSEAVITSGKPAITAETIRRMALWLNAIPGIHSFWLFDADGRVVYTTQQVEVAGVDFADREYFKAHRDGQDLHVGRLTRGRLDKVWFFSLSKRLVDDSGKFQGVLLASLGTEYFSDLYKRLGLGVGDNIAINRTDGAIIVRRLNNWPGDTAPSSAGHPIFTQYLPKASDGVFEAFSPIDLVNRVGAYRRVEGWPLVVSAASDWNAVLAPWRERAMRSAAYCGLMLAALLFMAWWGFLRTRGESDALAELTALNADLAKINEAKSRFFAAASHDLRQPMQAVRLLYEVLNLRIADRELRPALEQMGLALGAVETQLIESLEMARLESGDIKVNLERVDPAAVIREVLSHMAPIAAEKALPLRMFARCNPPVTSDPTLLKRVLLNLVSNAIRYTERGGVLVGVRRRNGAVAIEVWDTGIGIDPNASELVFEDYFQVGNGSRDRSQGTGLGLAIVRRLCVLLRCTVSLSSRPGRGSVFRLVLPAG